MSVNNYLVLYYTLLNVRTHISHFIKKKEQRSSSNEVIFKCGAI